ncbi:uncharacterized protein [Asterias amurensis]|uniref:uncharacterized protein n=1 Tax=Asterias amurensis TaxID=7602 RepID=UPI003AB36840
MAASLKRGVEVGVLLCIAFTCVLTSCVVNDGSTVEQRTRDVPLVIKGIVTSRSHTGSSIKIRVGKILKGSNESVAQNELDLVILEEEQSTTAGTTMTIETSNATVTTSLNTTTSHMNISLLSNNESSTSSMMMQSTSQAATQCLDGVGMFDRYIFFLRPLDDEGVRFEIVRDAVPQSKDNLRKVRQVVKEAKIEDGNETLELTIPDSHQAACETGNGSKWDLYCMNGGRCGYWKHLGTHFCICRFPYSGARCGVVDPATRTGDQPIDLNTTTLGIAAILAVLLLVVIICGIAYIRNKNSIWRRRIKEVEKRAKYLSSGAYSQNSPTRRESPIGGVVGYKHNSASSVVIFQEPSEGKPSRASSLTSSQYKQLTEVQLGGSNGDFRDQNSNRASRSSMV